MKFLGAASTGAITSLLLLVPAALGTQVYTCYRSQPLSKALIDDLARYATADQVYENDPGYGDRQVHKTHRFSKNKDATMKFLGAASTGAITSLLLLVPAALGTQVYTCYRSQPLSKALIDDLARYATADQVYENDPGYGDRQVHKTHRFSKNKDAT
ncbi:Bgt-51731, partial [Blumeria graminis f. sp. tritici]